VRTIRSYLRAFASPFTYNPRRNLHLWFGLLWGLPVPLFSIALDLALAPAAGRGPVEVVREHPYQLFFLAHPLLFALVFGAMGSMRHDLERENEELIRKLTSLAATDALTGLPNRRYALDDLEKSVMRSARTRTPFAVVIFDLDGFKRINDEQGHLAGDELLRRAAKGLLGVIRQGDVLGRYGGDEFILIAHGPLPEADVLAERARESVRSETGLGVTAGLARFPEDGETAAALIEKADARMYETKRRLRPGGLRSA
jgi:diguanylate cyclase (GGDEF)-like protein